MVRFIGRKFTANKTGDRDPPMTAIIHAWSLCSFISHLFSSCNCHDFLSELRHSGFKIYTIVNVFNSRWCIHKIKDEIDWLMVFVDTQKLVVFFYLKDVDNNKTATTLFFLISKMIRPTDSMHTSISFMTSDPINIFLSCSSFASTQ